MNDTTAHSPKVDCRTELDARREELLAVWLERSVFGFVAIDPRTVRQREAGAAYLERERGYARIWLRVHELAAGAAAKTMQRMAIEKRPVLRLIAGGGK